jgi:ATP-dependent helicase/nuclease subunit B
MVPAPDDRQQTFVARSSVRPQSTTRAPATLGRQAETGGQGRHTAALAWAHMAIRVRWTGYGEAAARALHASIAEAKAGQPLAPVTVVVSSNHVGVATRRLLASGTLGPVAGTGVGLAAVTFLTPYRLAELLGAAALAAQGRRPVSTPVLAAAVRAELAGDAGLFSPVADHPATESALVRTYRELRDLSPAALDALSAASDRAREVVRLHRGARRRLEPRWSDEEDLLVAAAAAMGGPAATELGAVVVHLPQRLSQHSARLLTALAEHVPTTVVAGLCGVAEADAEVLATVARLGIAPPDAPPATPALVSPDRTRIVTASDADDEVRAAVRAVVDAVRAGTRLDRIAVLHASPEPYARLAHEQLQAAGVATNGAAVVPLASRMAGRTLLDLLELPEGGFRRQDVFAWLSSGPVLHDGRWAPVTAWERLSREATVVAGRHDWDTRLTQVAAHHHRRAEQAAADADAPEREPAQERELAERAGQLRAFVLHVIDDLDQAARAPRPWSEHAAWAQRWLTDLLGPAARRTSWPDAERKAAERVELALDRLAALDAIEGPVTLAVFARTLGVELEADLGRVGRFGEGVLVGSVELAIGLDLDLVVVLGLAEGSFPATVRDDSLLPDRERVACGGELDLRAARVDRQHRHLLAALAGARRHLLCLPRGDLRRSVERMPSRWVLDLAPALAGADGAWWGPDLLRASAPWLQHVASFDAGIRHAAVPATAQEHRLRTLLSAGGDLTATGDAVAAAAGAVVEARRSARFTRFDGNLAGLDVPSPRATITSPTRLERWATCPHAHLVQDILGALPVENPEEALMISALEQGTLIHQVLEDFITAVLGDPAHELPSPSHPWSAAHHHLIERIGSAVCDRWEAQGLTGRPIFWTRDRRRILADLHGFLLHDDVHRAGHGTSPLAVELGFGFPEGDPPVEVELPDGQAVRFRGRADRLDLGADGTLHVVDYKTGKLSDSYKAITAEDPVGAGTKLQLPIYGLAARAHQRAPAAPVRAEYWFVTRRGEFKRKGYDVTDDVLVRTRATLGVIVSGIEAGRFPPHPEAMKSTALWVSCPVCDPDGLGTVELRQQWERKRHDPAMAPYAELAEPVARQDGPA